MSGRLSYSTQIFDDIANNYDRVSTRLSVGQIRRWHRAACARVSLRASDRLLDVGCGTGMFLRFCSEKSVERSELVGIDPSAAMLGVARRQSRLAAHQSIRWVEGIAESLPFPDNYFDWVTAQFSLRNMRDWRRALAEMHRVTKPGGHLLVLDLFRPVSPLARLGRWYVSTMVRTLRLTPYQRLSDSLGTFATEAELIAAMQTVWLPTVLNRWWGGLVVLLVAEKLVPYRDNAVPTQRSLTRIVR